MNTNDETNTDRDAALQGLHAELDALALGFLRIAGAIGDDAEGSIAGSAAMLTACSPDTARSIIDDALVAVDAELRGASGEVNSHVNKLCSGVRTDAVRVSALVLSFRERFSPGVPDTFAADGGVRAKG